MITHHILLTLQNKLDELAKYGGLDTETQRNVLKEELQYYILHFVYRHPTYSNWTMYGGSALRICHNLDRMSVDLDFEVPDRVSESFLNALKKEVETYFLHTHGLDSTLLTVKKTGTRGLRLNFQIGEALGLKHSSKQVHVKIDLNHFTAPKTVIDRIPITHGQLSFVIRTYNMSALMASKIAAIFLRGTRGVGKAIYEEKGRDIYDLLWYMNNKIVPDLDYLMAKGVNIRDVRALFDRLTIQMNKVNNVNLKQDLTPLFVNQTYIAEWLENWRESYFRLLDDYEIYTVSGLKSVEINKDFATDVYTFVYQYGTEDQELVRIIYRISHLWIDFSEGNLPVTINKKMSAMIESGNSAIKDLRSREKVLQYATLFYEKCEGYFKKMNHVMIGDVTTTKLIRMTADNLNHGEEILLNTSTLLSCDLDDLLK